MGSSCAWSACGWREFHAKRGVGPIGANLNLRIARKFMREFVGRRRPMSNCKYSFIGYSNDFGYQYIYQSSLFFFAFLMGYFVLLLAFFVWSWCFEPWISTHLPTVIVWGCLPIIPHQFSDTLYLRGGMWGMCLLFYSYFFSFLLFWLLNSMTYKQLLLYF